MRIQFSQFILQLIPFLYLLLSGCGASDQTRDFISQQSNIFNSKHVSYGLFSKIENEKHQLYLGWQVPRSELAFTQTDSGFVSVLHVQLSVKKSEIESLWDSSFTITTKYKTFDETRIYLTEKYFVKIQAPPGNHLLYCVLTEGQNTSSDIRIYSNFTVPETNETIQLSTIRFMDDFKTNNISLTKQLSRNNFRKPSVDFDILTEKAIDPIHIQLIISKIKSDTTIARSFSALSPFNMAIEAKGYKTWDILANYTVIDSIIKPEQKSNFRFSYLLPDSFQQGTYLAKVHLSGGAKILVSPEERFFVFPDFFPETKTLADAVKIVKYIAFPSEYEKIISGGDSTLKENFDRFWLKLSDGNKEAAKKKIAKFYQRVNEANILFSNYKPGWKTDLGMTYILLGPPDQIQWEPSSLTWYYYFRKGGGNIPLNFKPIRDENTIIGYYLERYFEYEEFWQEYRRGWEKNF